MPAPDGPNGCPHSHCRCALYRAFRFIIGGHGNLFDSNARGDTSHVRAAAVRLSAELEAARWQYDWAGWPAMTKDHTPHLLQLERGVYAGLGYNGRGVASATLMGAQLASVSSSRH